MHPVRKQRLYVVLAIVLVGGLAISLLVYALRDNMNLFYPPSQILAGEAPTDRTIRAGGCVVPGTIKKATDSLRVEFDITDGGGVLPVAYEGILPDLFDEGEAAVLTGQLQQDGTFMASTVLAKHDETYMPPEVAESMQTSVEGEHTARCGEMKFGATYDS